MQAFPSAKTSRDSALPFTACAGVRGPDLWGPGSHAVQPPNHEQDAAAEESAQRGRWSPLPGGAVPRPTSTPQMPQVQSLRLKHRASGSGATGRVHPKPGASVRPAHALALLNSSSLGHRGQFKALPNMCNLLPHGPFGALPSNTQQGSGMCGSGGSGPCSPFRPAAACSQMVPSPEPPASYSAAQAPQQLQQPQQPYLQPVQVQHVGCWPAPVCLDALQQGQAAALPPLLHPPQLPPLPPFCLPVPTGGGEGAGPTQQFGEDAAERQPPFSLTSCLAMDFDFSMEFSDGLSSKESSPATTIGLHALMDEVQEHGDTLTSTLMVNSDIFRPLPLQASGEAERERLAREAARALRMLHGDSITPSPECLPLLPVETPLGPPLVTQSTLPEGQQQAHAAQQPAPAAQQQVQVPRVAPPAAQAAAAAAARPPPLVGHSGVPAVPAVPFHTGEPMQCSPFAGAARQVHSHSSSGFSGGSSSDCGQVSSSGSESSDGGDGSGATSDGGVTALLALCHIANQPESQAAPVKPEPAVLPATVAGELLKQPQQLEQPQRPPRARQQAQRQAQRAPAQRAGRKPRKPSGGSNSPGSRSPTAAKLGVKQGSVRKARAAPAGSPAAKRARAAPAAAATASPGVARKAGAKVSGKAVKGPKPEPKRALSIDLLEAEGCFDMRQDEAAAHMGFGKTWFKEAIKKIGIEKWPYRQLTTLKHNVLVPLEDALAQHGRLCSPRRASELLAAVRAEVAAVRDKAMRASSTGRSTEECLLSDAMRGLRQDISYKPRNEAKRAADEGSTIPEEKIEREVQRVVYKWHAKLCQPGAPPAPQRK